MPLFTLDQYDDAHLVMMAAVAGDSLDPSVEEAYLVPVAEHAPEAKPVTRIDRFAFYDQAEKAFAVVMTGETAKYGNIILKKVLFPAKYSGSLGLRCKATSGQDQQLFSTFCFASSGCGLCSASYNSRMRSMVMATCAPPVNSPSLREPQPHLYHPSQKQWS